MENKINIAKILKDCPKDMSLDSTMYDDVYFDYVDDLNVIYCYINQESLKTSIIFNQYGAPNNIIKAKCVIFPKGKTTWEGFQRPFKDGDILVHGDTIYIYNGIKDNLSHGVHVIIDSIGLFAVNTFTKRYVSRFATEEEKEKLFQAIKDNGYKWNAETKTLEKLVEPKFKVGDKIRHKTHIRQGNVVTEIKDTHYILDDELALPFISQDEYELVPNKFDITTLNPFDKVLVRDTNGCIWRADFYSHYEDNQHYSHVCTGDGYHQCIPYNEETAHLVGTTNDCPDKYKTWKDEQ